MPKFTDAKNREWNLKINMANVNDVFDATGVSIPKLLDDGCAPLAELLDNLPRLVHVCYCIVGAKAAGVGEREFGCELHGDILLEMVDAFWEAITDFFPDGRRRAALAQMGKGWKALNQKTLAKLTEEMEKIDMEKVTDQMIEKYQKSQKTNPTQS